MSQSYPDIRSTLNLPPRIFGCTSFVHIHSSNRGKLDSRALNRVFVWYSATQKGYKCYHPSSQKFNVSADVTFVEDKSLATPHLQGEFLLDLPTSKSESFESKLPIQTKENDRIIDRFRFDQVYTRRKSPTIVTRQEQNSDMISGNEITASYLTTTPATQTKPLDPIPPNQDQDQDLAPIAVRKGTQECTKKPLYPVAHYVSLEKFSSNHKSFLTTLNAIPIPNSLAEALSKKKLRLAMRGEMDALEKNETWELVDLPKGKKPMGCKWVFAVKLKADGSLERYKARLVAKGYTQTYGVDYHKIFALVAKMNTERTLLSLAINFDWELQQYDVKNAFLHGELEEEIYMGIPPRFSGVGEGKVYRLKKALYGLKQSPCAWFGRFAKVMLTNGYK